MIVLLLSLWSLGLEAWSPLQDKKGMTPMRPERRGTLSIPKNGVGHHTPSDFCTPPQSDHCYHLREKNRRPEGRAVLG